MENVFFHENYASNYGGSLFLSFCTDFTMVNTAFTHNTADCIHSPSHNCTHETYESNIFSANPLFDFGTYNPFPYLQSNSPCIDAGSYSCGTQYDLFGNFRVTGIDADLGAMEYQQ